MNIVSTGEKIKKLRTDIGLKQDDISNDEITRSLISMIENNKRNLTYRTAKIIATELNKYYVNLGAEITPDLLMESEVQQAQRIIREKLDEMQQLLENPTPGTEGQVYQSFQKLIDFAKEWKLEEMIANLHEARGKFYYKTYQYNKALEDFFDALGYYLKEENYESAVSLYNFIGSCYYQLDLPEQALIYYQIVNKIIDAHHPSNSQKLKMFIHKNIILCYRKFKKFDMALKAISDFKDFYKNEDRHLYEVLLMEGNTYLDIQNYEKARRTYDKLLKKSDKLTPGLLFLLYDNYADFAQRKGEYQLSLKYIETAFEYVSEADVDDGTYLYVKRVRACWKLGKIDEANSLINEGLEMAAKVSKIDVIIDLTFLQIQMEIIAENYHLAEKKLKWLKHYIEHNGMKEKISDVHLYFMELYCKAQDYNKCLEYINSIHSPKSEYFL